MRIDEMIIKRKILLSVNNIFSTNFSICMWILGIEGLKGQLEGCS